MERLPKSTISMGANNTEDSNKLQVEEVPSSSSQMNQSGVNKYYSPIYCNFNSWEWYKKNKEKSPENTAFQRKFAKSIMKSSADRKTMSAEVLKKIRAIVPPSELYFLKDGDNPPDDGWVVTITRNLRDSVKENDPSSVLNCTESVSEFKGITVIYPGLPPIRLIEDDSECNDLSEYKNEAKWTSCPVCDTVFIEKCSLSTHLQNENKAVGTLSFKCHICCHSFPNKCALIMHLNTHRYAHEFMSPFFCPACEDTFHVFVEFITHLKHICCHESRCVRYKCTACTRLVIPDVFFHCMTEHVKSIVSCSKCRKSFINLSDLLAHMTTVLRCKGATIKYYNICDLCENKCMFPRDKFLDHLEKHFTNYDPCDIPYQCPTCKNTFLQKTDLLCHRMECKIRDDTTGNLRELEKENEKEMEKKKKKEKISSAKKMKLAPDDNDKTLENMRNSSASEGFQANDETPNELLIELCDACKKRNVIILSADKHSLHPLCCTNCVHSSRKSQTSKSDNKINLKIKNRIICSTTKYMDVKVNCEHFKTDKESAGQSVTVSLVMNNKSPKIKRSNTNALTTAETNEDTERKLDSFRSSSLTRVIAELQATLNHNKPDSVNKKPDCFLKSNQEVAERTSFESGQIMTCEYEERKLNCKKCDFICNIKRELCEHVATHHAIGTDNFQCFKCGDLFDAVTSLEIHLKNYHGKTLIENYRSRDRRLVKKMWVPISPHDKEQEKTYACSVCQKSFQSKSAFERHFRSHGMAFMFNVFLTESDK